MCRSLVAGPMSCSDDGGEARAGKRARRSAPAVSEATNIFMAHELRTAFRAYDRHGDGVVSPTELRTALFDLGIELSTQQILDLISTVGGSKDDTTVDYVQFARLLAPRRDADLRQTVKEVRSTLAQLNIGIERSLKGLMHGDGIISRREMRSGLLSLHAGLTLRQVDDLVDAADSRHDGRIDIHAFVHKFRGTHSVARGVAQLQRELQDLFHRSGVNLREAFSAFDRDGDGVISRHEFIEGLRSLELGLSATQMEDVLTLVDKDGDGRIEYAEFVRQFGAPRLETKRSGHDLGTALLRQTDGDLVMDERDEIEHIMSQLAQETGCFDGESTQCFGFATNLLKRGFGRTERSLPRTAGGV